jgi:hypothetical protein
LSFKLKRCRQHRPFRAGSLVSTTSNALDL